MAIDVTDATFEADVLQASERTPVVVDFWAEWCGPCRTLGPVLERAAAAREGELVLAKVDVDSNQALGTRYGVQGIPAVKAFRNGKVTSEFVGAQPPARVEAFMAALVPSEADRLFEAGDEASLRQAIDLEPGKAGPVLALVPALRERGDDDEALELLGTIAGSFEADGLAARIELRRTGEKDLVEAVAALDGSETERGLELLLAAIPASEDVRREQLRRAIVGTLAGLGPEDPRGRDYRRRLATALY